MIRPVVVEMGKAQRTQERLPGAMAAVLRNPEPAQAAERAADLTRAWDDLPAALKAHPGIKALHRAAVAALPAAPVLPVDTLCWRCNKGYPMLDVRCPHCAATNANFDPETAWAERQAGITQQPGGEG